MVYHLSWDAEKLPVLPFCWQALLPAGRIEKAKRYLQEKDRTTSVLAFLLLRYSLYKEYDISAQPQLAEDENGKPYAVSGDYHFNLSHCDCAVACAVDANPIGVDVQHFRCVSTAVIKKVCSDAEQSLLQNANAPERLFAAFWAGKEAYGKRTGQGIGYELRDFSFCPDGVFPAVFSLADGIVQTELFSSFALSVCAAQRIEAVNVSFQELTDFAVSLL